MDRSRRQPGRQWVAIAALAVYLFSSCGQLVPWAAGAGTGCAHGNCPCDPLAATRPSCCSGSKARRTAVGEPVAGCHDVPARAACCAPGARPDPQAAGLHARHEKPALPPPGDGPVVACGKCHGKYSHWVFLRHTIPVDAEPARLDLLPFARLDDAAPAQQGVAPAPPVPPPRPAPVGD